MIGKTPNQQQTDLFRPLLSTFIDMNHELVLLAQKLDWAGMEKDLSVYYSTKGQPSVPIRMMAGCLILKQLYNLGDETLAKAWVMNPYMQYFCGESHFQHTFPFDPSDFVHFRHRIGESGVNTIFVYSVKIHGKQAEEAVVVSDTTVQGNNITFPTDSKLYKKIIDKCVKIAGKHHLVLRQSYKRVSKQLLRDTYNSTHPKRRKQAKKARAKLQTIAGRLLRELERLLPAGLLKHYEKDMELWRRVLLQQKNDKHKIYSLHKPYTDCISKGKAHKPYEFGNKVGFLMTSHTLIITAIRTYLNNPHDNRTIEPLVEQLERNNLPKPKEIDYDRAAKGVHSVRDVEVCIPGKALKKDTAYTKQKKRKKFRRRTAIEPVNAHLKFDFRMEQNYLWGESYIQINALLSAMAWNLKKWMERTISCLCQKGCFCLNRKKYIGLYEIWIPLCQIKLCS